MSPVKLTTILKNQVEIKMAKVLRENSPKERGEGEIQETQMKGNLTKSRNNQKRAKCGLI